MKVKKYIIYLPVAAISLALTSCNDFLNKYPDSRMDLKNPTEVSQLLVSAYPQAHPAYLTEMYSDNTDEQLHSTWSAFDRFQEQAYQWKDIDDVSNTETPYQLWSAHYAAISACNEAIEYIERTVKDAQSEEDYRAQLGEALLCRAFSMFQLSTVFCQAYDKTTAANQLGLPYPTEPEKPTIKATYHFDILYTKPQLEKKVLDENNNDIDTNTVKTGSVVKFALNTTAFPAGHEKITSVVMNDVLPEGYKLNLEETKKASPDYEVSYDEGTRTLVFTAKATLLDQINADLTKEAPVPAPIIVGTVTKEGTTYENQFDLDINNVFKKKSNKVTVKTPEPPTPPTPKKHKGAVPYTGDSNATGIAIALASAAVVLIGGGVYLRRRSQRE